MKYYWFTSIFNCREWSITRCDNQIIETIEFKLRQWDLCKGNCGSDNLR